MGGPAEGKRVVSGTEGERSRPASLAERWPRTSHMFGIGRHCFLVHLRGLGVSVISRFCLTFRFCDLPATPLRPRGLGGLSPWNSRDGVYLSFVLHLYSCSPPAHPGPRQSLDSAKE